MTRYLLLLALLATAADAQGVQPWDTNILQWNAPTTCTSGQPIANCAVTGYRVERSTTTTGTFASVGTSTTTSFTHTSAPAGQNCYRVIALSAKGESVPSNVACKTNTQPSGPPNPPDGLVVVDPIAYNLRVDYGRFAFLRGTRAGKVALGTPCDETRVTADGYNAIKKRGSVLVAKCAAA